MVMVTMSNIEYISRGTGAEISWFIGYSNSSQFNNFSNRYPWIKIIALKLDAENMENKEENKNFYTRNPF